MRIEVIADGETLDRHDFLVLPEPGHLIEFHDRVVQVQEIRHNFKANRLQAWCTKHTPSSTERPLKQRSKQPEE